MTLFIISLENLDLSTSIIFYNSQKNIVKREISNKFQSKTKQQTSIDEPKDFIKNNVENVKFTKSRIIQEEELCMKRTGNDFSNTQSRLEDMANCSIVGKRLRVNENDENLGNSSDDFQSEYQLEDLKTSKSSTRNRAELNILESNSKEEHLEMKEIPSRFSNINENTAANLEEISFEKETYKDCLTDSDERRKARSLEVFENLKQTPRSMTSFDGIAKTEINADEMYAAGEVTLDNKRKVFESTSKSDTFIRNLQNDNEEYENEYHNEDLNSSEDLSISESTTSATQELESVSNNNSKRISTPRTVKSLKLKRLPSPPPKLSRTAPPTTPHGFTSEINNIKYLNMCQSKRKKVLRQTASCSNTSPMKAIHLSKESLDICNVSSAPQFKASKANRMKEEEEEEEEEEKALVEKDYSYTSEGVNIDELKIDVDEEASHVEDKEIKVIKEPQQLKRNRSFTISGLPDNYDPFLSAKRQLEELCSPTSDNVDIPTTPYTPHMPSLPTTPNTKTMSTSLILSSSTPQATPNQMSTSQMPQQTQKTPTLARSSSFRRTSSLRGPRRSPLLAPRPPLFAQKHRPTIQRGLSDEGPISTNFLKPEEYDEMPVRSVCVNDFALNKSPRVVRRDTSTSNRKQPLKLNISAANGNNSSATVSPNITEPNPNTTSKYVSKTDSLAVFLKYEHELEKLNKHPGDTNEHKKENSETTKTPSTASTISTPLTNLDGPLNAKELKDKSNNLSKQNSAKNIKADILEIANSTENYDNVNQTDLLNATENNSNSMETSKYGQVRLAPLETKPSTPLTKPSTPLTKSSTPLSTNKPSTPQQQQTSLPTSVPTSQENRAPKSSNPVALSSIFGSDNKTITTKQSSLQSNLLYTERQNSIGSDYIDPKLINKCDNLPINLNLKRLDLKHSDSDASETRMEHFSSSSSESSAPAINKSNNLTQHTKFLPSVRQQQHTQHQHQQQQQQQDQNNNLKPDLQQRQNVTSSSVTNSQRNSAEGRNLLKRRMRLGRNQFLYDASPEGDSCSADDEGANRSSMECETLHRTLLREHEKVIEHLTSAQANSIDAPPFIPPLPAFDDFDFEEFLSSFENDEEQFPIFKDCREFLLNRTSKKQRSMLMSNSVAQNINNTSTNTNNSSNFKKSPSPQTFPPLTPQSYSTTSQHFQFPTLPQQPKNLFDSFSPNTRTKNKYDEITSTKSIDTFTFKTSSEAYKDVVDNNHQKREIFISIETEQNDLDKSPISPNSIRNMVGNPQTVVEVEVDAAHDNKFSKISDDDTDNPQHISRSNNFPAHLEHLPNVQLNNAKNLMQKMNEDFRQMGDDMSDNLRLTMEHRAAIPVDVKMNSNTKMPATRNVMSKVNRSPGTPSGDAYADSDELSSLDGYPLSSPNSRLGVSSKTSADSAYGSLSRQRSSELTSQRCSSRSRPITSSAVNTLFNRPLTEESSQGRSRQLSASSSSSSEHALPPISKSNSYHKQHQQQHQQQQQHYNNNNNNNDLDDLMLYERNNNNYDVVQPIHPTTTGSTRTNSQSNLESLQQYNTSNSTMSTSMKMSRFCHECGSKFLLEQAKFCMDCGVKRLIL